MRIFSALALAVGLGAASAGCGSSEPTDEKPAPRPTSRDVEAKPDSKPEPLEAITIGQPDAGNVSFDFKDADLAQIVLPLFAKQAGVLVEYGGPPRKIASLRLRNVPWRDALNEVCRFTRTHVTEGPIAGHLELRPGFVESMTFLDRWDPEHAAERSSTGWAGTGAVPSEGVSTGSLGAGGPPAQETIEDPNAKGKEQIERLRTGVSTTSSGGR